MPCQEREVMPEINVEIEVWCSCGEGLCNQSSDSNKGRGAGIEVEPCGKCLETAKQQGYDEGYDEAQKENVNP